MSALTPDHAMPPASITAAMRSILASARSSGLEPASARVEILARELERLDPDNAVLRFVRDSMGDASVS